MPCGLITGQLNTKLAQINIALNYANAIFFKFWIAEYVCPENFYKCDQKKHLKNRCIPVSAVCDGEVDCAMGDDEFQNCSKYAGLMWMVTTEASWFRRCGVSWPSVSTMAWPSLRHWYLWEFCTKSNELNNRDKFFSNGHLIELGEYAVDVETYKKKVQMSMTFQRKWSYWPLEFKIKMTKFVT